MCTKEDTHTGDPDRVPERLRVLTDLMMCAVHDNDMEFQLTFGPDDLRITGMVTRFGLRIDQSRVVNWQDLQQSKINVAVYLTQDVINALTSS